MTLLISIAVAMAAGLFMTRVMNKLNMPDVTAYLVAGILIGPYALGALGVSGLGFNTNAQVENLSLLSSLALGFIAFAIGTEFMLPKLRSTGKQATVIAIVQACLASVLVAASLIGLHFLIPDKISLPEAVILGAVASATAPAATLMVVRQYKASGPVTNILLPVVALDDAVGLFLFALAMGIAKSLLGGSMSIMGLLVNPLAEIIGSLALGAFLGWLMTQTERAFHSNRNRLTLLISFVTAAVALSMLELELGELKIGFSPLLTNMMMGTVFCNTCPVAEELMDRENKWTSPLYCLFFVLSGAALRLDVFSDLAMVGVGAVYIIARSLGKYLGAGWSAAVTGCDPMVRRYLGFTLLPQAGVALGMSLTASQILGADGAVVRSITLFGVLIYELVGPALTKQALISAGEIAPQRRDARTGKTERIEGRKHGKAKA